jgi:FAD/FMN-containing dehydrogenase
MAHAHKIRRRVAAVAAIALGIPVLLFIRPGWYLLRAAWRDADVVEPLPPGMVDDASRLNRTRVSEVWSVPPDPDDAERQLADLLRRAAAEGLKVSIAGSRHTMGGHAISPDGLVIDMLPFDAMELDEVRDLLRVGAGARWSRIIPYLDARGRSVRVMQSNNSFSVGGSLGANCHGWQFGRPPIASTVESFRLMRADGSVVRCSREENRELFSLALGGYGLFGVMLDVDLRVAPNERLRLEQRLVPVDAALETFEQMIRQGPDVSMVYARMNVTPERLFDQVVINLFHHETDGTIPELAEPGAAGLKRAIFRGSADSDYGKQLRWEAETRLQPFLSGKVFSRNQLLNEGVEFYRNRSADSTDILHEYFVPHDGVDAFVPRARDIVLDRGGNLLNVTVRYVETDEDAFLRYAERPMFAFVMLFNQRMTPEAEETMAAMTRELIDASLDAGGRYYLPYRLHATPEQFHRAYPQGRRFFDLKRQYDPGELFVNRFYLKYGSADRVDGRGNDN